jgi:arylsulfatase A-like enzyme
MDLMPTILDYADIAVPPELSATSLRPLVEQKQTAQRDIFCELDGMNDPSHWIYWNASHFDLRAVYRDEWKYIHHVGCPEADELYRLNTTRVNETENLIAVEPVIAQQLQGAIMNNFGLWKNALPFIAG